MRAFSLQESSTSRSCDIVAHPLPCQAGIYSIYPNDDYRLMQTWSTVLASNAALYPSTHAHQFQHVKQ